VNSKVSNFPGYKGTQPVLYNMYGHLTWVVPVITENGILQRIARVNASTGEITLGEHRQEALLAYRQSLSAKLEGRAVPALEATGHTVTGIVGRIAADTRGGNTTYYVVLADDAEQHVFTGASTLSYKLPIAQTGDTVTIGYDETTEATVPMSSFDLPVITTHVSREQSQANELQQEREQSKSKK
jgi:hypothetical protein